LLSGDTAAAKSPLGKAGTLPFTMKFPEAPPGGFALSYERQQTKNFGFLIPGDKELFVGGGALNGAVGKLLFEHANQPIQFYRAADGSYETIVENGKDVPKFTKETCPYKKTQKAVFNKALNTKDSFVVAEPSEIGDLPVVFSCGRTYSDCDHPFGCVFLHVFKDANCPFGVKQNAALLYCVGALGVNAKAPGEGAPDHARLEYVKSDVQDFLYEIFRTGESVVQLVFDYNKLASVKGLPVLEVIRLPVVSGGIFLHPDLTQKEAALALIWGVHSSLAKNSVGSRSLAIELMPGKPMEEAYKDYSANKKPHDWNTKDLKNIFGKISLQSSTAVGEMSAELQELTAQAASELKELASHRLEIQKAQSSLSGALQRIDCLEQHPGEHTQSRSLRSPPNSGGAREKSLRGDRFDSLCQPSGIAKGSPGIRVAGSAKHREGAHSDGSGGYEDGTFDSSSGDEA